MAYNAGVTNNVSNVANVSPKIIVAAIQRRNGIAPYTAIIEATVSRTRPVLMAATTTILGMVPLLFDIAFGGIRCDSISALYIYFIQ